MTAPVSAPVTLPPIAVTALGWVRETPAVTFSMTGATRDAIDSMLRSIQPGPVDDEHRRRVRRAVQAGRRGDRLARGGRRLAQLADDRGRLGRCHPRARADQPATGRLGELPVDILRAAFRLLLRNPCQLAHRVVPVSTSSSRPQRHPHDASTATNRSNAARAAVVPAPGRAGWRWMRRSAAGRRPSTTVPASALTPVSVPVLPRQQSRRGMRVAASSKRSCQRAAEPGDGHLAASRVGCRQLLLTQGDDVGHHPRRHAGSGATARWRRRW